MKIQKSLSIRQEIKAPKPKKQAKGTAEVPAFEAKAQSPVVSVSLPAKEFLARFDAGKSIIPWYQREGTRWPAPACRKLADTILGGKHMLPLTFTVAVGEKRKAELAASEKALAKWAADELNALKWSCADGLQRSTNLLTVRNWWPEGTPQRDAIDAYIIRAEIVICADEAEEREVFQLANLGIKLDSGELATSRMERSTEEVREGLVRRLIKDSLPRGGGKASGKKLVDMLIHAAIEPARAHTKGQAAAEWLVQHPQKNRPRAIIAALDAVAELDSLQIGAYKGLEDASLARVDGVPSGVFKPSEYWGSAPRLVALTALLAAQNGYAALGSAKIARILWGFVPGAAFADTGNTPSATASRVAELAAGFKSATASPEDKEEVGKAEAKLAG